MGVICIFLSHLGSLALEAKIFPIQISLSWVKEMYTKKTKHLREAAFDFNIVRAI